MEIKNRIIYDGFSNTISLVLQKLKNLYFRRVTTYLFRFEASSALKPRVCCDDLQFSEVYDNLLILSKKAVESYRNKGGRCISLRVNGTLVGYAWFYTGSHYINGVGNISLSENASVWVGPVFIQKAFRGRGYNKLLLEEVVQKKLGARPVSILTSINSKNLASIRSFISFGFRKVAVIESQYKYGRLTILDRRDL